MPVPSPVKRKAVELKIPVLQPEKLDRAFRDGVAELDPDILVVVAFGKIFRERFLSLFPLGGINLHPSLLPAYRGPSPIPAAILAGDAETGITVQRLALRMDEGDILAQERVRITADDTTQSLSATISQKGASLLATVLDRLSDGPVAGSPQRESDATYCHLIEKEDGFVNWTEGARKIERMIRAYFPWPRAYTFYRGLRLTLLQATALPDSGAAESRPGHVGGMDKTHGILINTGKGILAVRRLQLQSRKPMDWQSFLNGNRAFIGSMLGGQE
jgi:methionyl-tRNA formyltransferase